MKFTIGPNIGSVDMVELCEGVVYADWVKDTPGLDELQLYGQNILYNRDAPGVMLGENTYPNLRGTGGLRSIAASALDLMIETGAVKEWDCSGAKSIANLREIVLRVEAAEGKVAGVVMDEPLVAGVKPPDGGSPYGHCFDHHHVHEVAATVAVFVRAARELGLQKVAIAEAMPFHDVPRILAFVKHVHVDEQAPIDRFVLDFNPWGYGKKGWHDREFQRRFPEDLRALQVGIKDLGIEFAVIVTAHGADNIGAYRSQVMLAMTHVLRTLEPDRLVVQSWNEHGGRKQIPRNLPPGDWGTHTNILAHLSRVAHVPTWRRVYGVPE